MDSKKRIPFPVNTIYIIGTGGVASWLLPVLLKLLRAFDTQPTIVLMDGDKLEPKNLDRQLFSPEQVGQFKSDALKVLYAPHYDKLTSCPEFFTEGTDGLQENSLYLCCVDNMAARKAVLQAVDRLGGRAIFGANEYTDSEAYWYEQDWQGTALDPRTFYPTITTDERDDPTRPQSCQGVASDASPQLVLANFSAANFMMWLLWFHYVERPKMDRLATLDYWPHHHRNNFSRFSTVLIGHTNTKK